MTVEESLAERWISVYVEVSGLNRLDAATGILEAGLAIGPPDSKLRYAAMAYIGAMDQRWNESKAKEK